MTVLVTNEERKLYQERGYVYFILQCNLSNYLSAWYSKQNMVSTQKNKPKPYETKQLRVWSFGNAKAETSFLKDLRHNHWEVEMNLGLCG